MSRPASCSGVYGLSPATGSVVERLEEQRDDLDQAADRHHEDDQHDQQADVLFDHVVR